MLSIKSTVKWFWIIALVVIIGSSVISCGGSGGGLGNAKWEYKILWLRIGYDDSSLPPTQETLNELGKEGWELVSVSTPATGNSSSSSNVFTFKRKL